MDVLLAARRWAETWQRAWPDKESQPIAALYEEAASYRSSPFDQPEVGGALAYVERQFAVEEAVECQFAEPIAAGDRAAIEWWASFVEAGQVLTLAAPRCCASMPMARWSTTWITGCKAKGG